VSEACILCGCLSARTLLTSSDQLFGIAPGCFRLMECEGCGLVRLSPRPTPEQVADFYAKNYWFAGSGLQELYRRMVLRDHVQFAVGAARRQLGTVLDVGCGGGLFLRMMKERGYEVLGLDFSAEAARVAQELNGVRVLVGDLCSADIAESSCGLVTMYHVVEHLLDPAAYLRAASRVLHPEGRLIVQVPDRDCWEAGFLGAHWTGLDVPRHLHVFRSSDLRRLLRSCGFEIVREKHFSLRDHPAGLATGIAPSLDPVVRGIRKLDAGRASALAKDLVYFGRTLAALPFTMVEAIFGKGSSVMVEARKR
jgi:2-polyprenyl-3-methyl-5-hydroxy-6-metoxy-1,4-benzoquinol methylase